MKVKHYIAIVQLDNGKFHQVWLDKEQENALGGFLVYLTDTTIKLNDEPLDGMMLQKLKTKNESKNNRG